MEFSEQMFIIIVICLSLLVTFFVLKNSSLKQLVHFYRKELDILDRKSDNLKAEIKTLQTKLKKPQKSIELTEFIKDQLLHNEGHLKLIRVNPDDIFQVSPTDRK